jgi:hypothetical protein
VAETLLNLRTQCKTEADMVNSSFVSDNEWNTWINRGTQEVYGLVVQVYGNDYFTQSPSTGFTITTDGLTQFFALPTDFFKLLGVDLLISAPGQYATLKEFPFQERNRLSIANNATPLAGQIVRLLYVPRFAGLTVDADTIPDALSMNGWSEYIIAWACRQAMMKEESDPSQFSQRVAELKARIESEAEDRDAGNPARVGDVAYQGGRAMRYRINGSNLWLIGNGASQMDYFGYSIADSSSSGWY